MICPRCGQVISDTETICPFCYQDIDRNIEFNDFRKDGFVEIRSKNEADTSESINYTPKYFNIAEFNIFVIAIVFILVVSLFTVFSLKFVQSTHVEYVPEYHVTTSPTEPETQETTVKNTVKKVTIKNLLGSWKIKGSEESETGAIPYYSFAKDGVAQENYGSITSTGTYKDLSEDNKNIVYILIDNGIKGTYYFDVTGNKDDGYTLTLRNIESGSEYQLVSATAKAKKLTPTEDLKLDKKLFGYWLSEDEEKSYRFGEDGIVFRVTGGTTTEGVWSVTDKNVITIQYMKDAVKSVTLDYILKDGKLYITETEYTKQNQD